MNIIINPQWIKKRSGRGIKALLFIPRDLSRWNGDLYISIFYIYWGSRLKKQIVLTFGQRKSEQDTFEWRVCSHLRRPGGLICFYHLPNLILTK